MKYWIMMMGVVIASCSTVLADRPLLLTAEKRISSLPPGWGELSFSLPEVPKGQQVRLSLDARVDWTDLAGFNPWMVVNVNGANLRGPSLLNKPVDFTTRNGVDFVWEKGGQWTILYSPNFSDTIRTHPMPWGFPDVDPFHFVWGITPCAKVGANKITITHVPLLSQGTTLVLRNVTVEVGEPVQSLGGGGVQPAPDGPLPTYITRGPQRVAMKVFVSPSGALRLNIGNRTCNLLSRTSEPEGKWVETNPDTWKPLPPRQSSEPKWKGTGYTVTRKVTALDDHIHVADTIANTSDKLVGVIYENRLDLAQADKPKILLAGRPPIAETYAVDEPGHPSAIAEWKEMALGMFAEDDIFRVHVRAFREANAIGLGDPRLGIAPGKFHTLEWSVYPAPKGDYYDVINAVRRNWGCNFTIPGPTLFDGATDGSKSREYISDMVRSRKLKLAFSGQTDFKGDEIKNGVDLAEGTAIPLARRWCASATEWVKKLHAADPDCRAMVYMHPSICTEPDAEKKYADCKILDPSGTHLTSPYRYPVYEYISSLDNAYGKAYFKTLETILSEINPDGIFMDEISHGSVPQYAYNTMWDGCTAIIDQNTHAVAGQCSSIVLLEQPWKSAMVKLLRERGKLLVGNGPCYTRTMLGWKMPVLTELGSYSFLINMHLSSPIALGNHDNDNDDRIRAKMVQRALNYAGVIYGYSWGDQPQGFHYMHVMFPITPVELRPGMILGRERIITNRSGSYGWPDGSKAEVYVFDGEGKPVLSPSVKQVRQGGKVLTELRMPSDHFAVLVKRTSA